MIGDADSMSVAVSGLSNALPPAAKNRDSLYEPDIFFDDAACLSGKPELPNALPLMNFSRALRIVRSML